MVAPALAPNVTTYASRTPYITSLEWQNAPTGVDADSLVPGGQAALDASQLAQTIAYASSMVDTYCNQVLAATLDTQGGRYRMLRDGLVKVPCDNSPVVAVNSVAWGWDPSALTSLTDLSRVWVGPKVVDIPLLGYGQPYPAAFGYPMVGGRVFVVLTYVNGYPNTLTSAAAIAGDGTLDVDATLGCFTGTVLTIADGENTEQVTVTDTTDTTLTLAAPLTYPHPVGVSVSNLPPAVKQATILLTTALIKTRGSEAIVMAAIQGEPSQQVPIEDGGLQEISLAKGLLNPFRRVT